MSEAERQVYLEWVGQTLARITDLFDQISAIE